MSVLDMTGPLQELFIASAQDTSVRVERHNRARVFVEGRSRRRRRRRRKDDSSSDESNPESRDNGIAVVAERSISLAEIGLESSVGRMTVDLDGHVRSLRDDVERLAREGVQQTGSEDVRGIWGMLAIALEDWR